MKFNCSKNKKRLKIMETAKIISREQVSEIGASLRKQGKTIVFTNGCFDILHAGHASYLARAACQGDVLILGLNSDASVQSIKGDRRPIIPQYDRARLLSSLACVDYIVVFDESDPEQLIRSIKPHILVKGSDWQENEIIGADFVKTSGGRVERISLEPGLSTSLIIEKIVKNYASQGSFGGDA